MRPARVPAGLSLGLAMLLATSCAAIRAANTANPASASAPAPAPVASPRIERRLSIKSYTTRDGRRHEWMGSVEPAGADSLRFDLPALPAVGLSNPKPAQRLTLPRDEVTAIARTSVSATILAVVLWGALAGALVMVADFSQGFW